jgi:SAM-dependent methyltransferase
VSEVSAISAGTASRRCLACAAEAPLGAGEPLLPERWSCAACGWRPERRHGVPLLAPELADQISGFDPASFSSLEQFEDGHFWFEPRNRLIRGLADRFFPDRRSYMEIGCGTGFVLRAFAGDPRLTRIVGSELQPAGLQAARRRTGDQVELVQMDARALPARNAFDLIGAYDVIEHIAEDVRVLAEMHAAVRPGGGIILTVPQHPSLWSATDEAAHHVRRYRRGEMEAKAQGVGFEIVFSTSYTSLLLPLMAMSRLSARRSPGRAARDDVNGDEMRPGKQLNALLRGVLALEVSASLKGVRWPAGGSRVVVARKPAVAPRGAVA